MSDRKNIRIECAIHGLRGCDCASSLNKRSARSKRRSKLQRAHGRKKRLGGSYRQALLGGAAAIPVALAEVARKVMLPLDAARKLDEVRRAMSAFDAIRGEVPPQAPMVTSAMLKASEMYRSVMPHGAPMVTSAMLKTSDTYLPHKLEMITSTMLKRTEAMRTVMAPKLEAIAAVNERLRRVVPPGLAAVSALNDKVRSALAPHVAAIEEVNERLRSLLFPPTSSVLGKTVEMLRQATTPMADFARESAERRERLMPMVARVSRSPLKK